MIDASDPAHPQVTAHLTDTPAALDPHETVHTNANTRILVAGQTVGRILRFMTFPTAATRF